MLREDEPTVMSESTVRTPRLVAVAPPLWTGGRTLPGPTSGPTSDQVPPTVATQVVMQQPIVLDHRFTDSVMLSGQLLLGAAMVGVAVLALGLVIGACLVRFA